jgi:hypothetical protein
VPTVSRRIAWALLLVLFAFRLGFGLCSDLFSEDETQIYLLGLRYHSTHAWPYFGPDVVWTQSQIPGALQALLAGLPLDVAAIPEAPYVLINLLSMGALCLFASYLSARLPTAPRWLIWGWLLTLPWTLNYSTHIMNPGYVLPASLMFFLGFFEAWPPLAIGRVRVPLAHALMGAAIAWIAQVHMSWPLLLPFAGLAFLARLREGPRAAAIAAGAFALGALATGSVLLPTFLKFGFGLGSGSTGQNLLPHWREPVSTFVKTAARILSFASLETNRFVASGSSKQIIFLWQHLWLVPFAAVVALVGIVHPVWMALTALRRRSALRDWPAVRWLTVGTIALVSLSFFFVVQPAQARMYYVVAPVAFVYAAYSWTFIDSRWWRRVAAGVLTINVLFQAGLMAARFPGASLYLDRALVAQAIDTRQADVFSHRRPFSRDASPADLAAVGASAQAPADLEITRATLSRPILNLTAWTLVIHNRSTSTAYRDLVCETIYSDGAGRDVDRHQESVWVVIQPGASEEVQVIDGVTWSPTVTGSEARIISALAVRPSGR